MKEAKNIINEEKEKVLLVVVDFKSRRKDWPAD